MGHEGRDRGGSTRAGHGHPARRAPRRPRGGRGPARERLIALTQGLIRIPTVNPPGANYREICEHLAAILAPFGFEAEMIRAHGAPGDTDAHPRWNLLARRAGRPPRPLRPPQRPHRRGGARRRLDGGSLRRRAHRGGRVYGRGASDMKGGIAAAVVAAEALIEVWPDHPGAIEISATADEESGGYGGVAHLAALGRFAPEQRPPRHHPRAARRPFGLPRPSRRLVGRDRDLRPHRPRLHALSRRLRDPPHGRRAPRLRGRAPAHAGRPPHRHARDPGRRPRLHDEPQLHPRRAGGAGGHRPALPLRPRQLPLGDRPAVPSGGNPGGRARRGDGSPRPPRGHPPRLPLRPQASSTASPPP